MVAFVYVPDVPKWLTNTHAKYTIYWTGGLSLHRLRGFTLDGEAAWGRPERTIRHMPTYQNGPAIPKRRMRPHHRHELLPAHTQCKGYQPILRYVSVAPPNDGRVPRRASNTHH